MTVSKQPVSASAERSFRLSRPVRLAITVAIALGVALASLAGFAALSDAPLLDDGQSVLRSARTAVARMFRPPIRRWLAGSGRPAAEISIYDPVGLVEDAGGNLYFADRGGGEVMGIGIGHFIWRLGPDNQAEVIAGTGFSGMPGDGQEALQADLGKPAGLAMDSRQRLYFADPENHVVMRLEADGSLTRLAGTGEPGYGGDGGAARAAQLNEPYDVALDAADNLYIADHLNHRVRMVTPDGTISTVAGTGKAGYTGDHGPAADAQLNGVYGVHVHPDGRLLIADSDNHVVRQIAADGIITTLVGTGEAGNSGDGGPAARARLKGPESVFVDAAGRLYIGDEYNHNIRVVDPDGTIDTVIGDGEPGYAVIGQPAATAPLNDPEYSLVRRDGSVVISDGDTGRLLTFDGDGRIAVLAGAATRTVDDAMRMFRSKDPEKRAAYERRLRAAGLPQ